MKNITIHAGHNPSGKIACGASDYIDESTEARYIVKKLVKMHKGSRMFNCTVNNGTSQADVLRKIVNKCNKCVRDFDVSIHFNAYKHSVKDGKTMGCEVLLYGPGSPLEKKAKQICKNMEKLGFKNRGVKYNKDLYFLKNTNRPAMLIEVCFVDDQDDATLYKKKRDEVVQAIYNGIWY